MTYLLKIEGDRTHHYRATVQNHAIEIVEGIFYQWLGKSWQGCGDNESATRKQKELIDEKLNDGFELTEFKEILENTLDVYDKAKWHFEGNFPEELDIYQGYVHTGLFLGWLIERDLVSEEFENDHNEEISLFKKQEMTGPKIFETCCDGVLLLEDLSEEGNRFALPYFNLDSGQYLADYEKILLQGLPSLYHVEDTWGNYSELKATLDIRFQEWKNSAKKKPFWKFWQ